MEPYRRFGFVFLATVCVPSETRILLHIFAWNVRTRESTVHGYILRVSVAFRRVRYSIQVRIFKAASLYLVSSVKTLFFYDEYSIYF